MVYAQNVLALVGEEHEGIITSRLKHATVMNRQFTFKSGIK